MFDSGYILLLLMIAILFQMWRGAGRFKLDMEALLEKDHQHHIHAMEVIKRIPHGATWKEYHAMADQPHNNEGKGKKEEKQGK